MKKSVFLSAAALAATGICAVCGAGEELMPLVPGAYSPVEFGDDGMQLRRVSSNDADPGEGKRPTLRKNIVRLTVPSLGDQTNAKMRMVEAAPVGPGGTLRFTPLESMPAARRGGADIPGLVPPELLAVSRMEQDRASKARGGFSPIRLPGALASGTEELSEFDPYSVQRTGNPFKDAPGTAEAFPAAAMQSRLWEDPLEEALPANNDPRLPAAPIVRPVPDAGAAPVPVAPVQPPAPRTMSLRPPAAGMGLRPPPPAAPVTVAEITLPPAPAVREMPPLPELPVRPYAGGGQARRAEVVSLPPPLPDRDVRNRGEFSLLSPSGEPEIAAGLKLALPPTALTEGRAQFAQPTPAPMQPMVAEGAFLRPGERIIDPQTLAPAPVPQAQGARQMVQAPPPVRRAGVPALSVDEFTPMRGMRVY